MKIAILAYSTADNSGTSVVARDQAALFHKAGCDVTLFTLLPNDKPLEILVKPLPQPLFRLPLWKFPWILLFSILPPPLHLPLIYRCIKPLSKFDVVIAYDSPVDWLGYYAKKLYGIKYVWFCQGLHLPETCEFTLEKLYFRLQTYGLCRLSAANADLVITETAFLQEILRHKFGIESTVIQNPTYLAFDTNTTGDEVRRNYQLDDDPLILYVDRLEKHKGIETLLDAFRLVLKAVPRAKLMLIGNCTRKCFWRMIQRRRDSSVILVNYVPHNEIAAFYAASTIFATCAVFEEGFSHTILEAQALGKPVVAFDVAAHKEVIRDEETGILISRVGDAREFASALISLLSNTELANSIGQKAIDWSAELADKGMSDFEKLLTRIRDL